MKAGNPILLVFREVLEGDVKKVQAKSNISQSGGGARDLRFRDADLFGPIIERMFNGVISAGSVLTTTVHWDDENDVTKSTPLELWPPTEARPNELRLAKIHSVKGWEVDENTYRAVVQTGNKLFFYLILDSLGNVWARLFNTQYLNYENPTVRDYLKNRILSKKGSTAIFGSIDFNTLTTFP